MEMDKFFAPAHEITADFPDKKIYTFIYLKLRVDV